MLLEVSAASENSAEQDRRVHGRHFGIPYPLAGIQVSEMVKEAAMRRHLFPQEAQREQNPIPRLGRGDESTLFSDTKSGESKPCCRDARDHGCVILQDIAPIFDQPGLRTRLVPKKLEVSLLQFVQKLVIFRREKAWGWRGLC